MASWMTGVRFSGNKYIFTLGIYSRGQEVQAHFCYLIATLVARIWGQERLHPLSVLVAIPCIYMCLHVGKWTLMQESIMLINNKLSFHCNMCVCVCVYVPCLPMMINLHNLELKSSCFCSAFHLYTHSSTQGVAFHGLRWMTKGIYIVEYLVRQ